MGFQRFLIAYIIIMKERWKQMKHLKRLLYILVTIFILLPADSYAAAPKLNHTNLNISTADNVTLKVLNTKKKVTWSSSNKDVVKVSQNGKLTAGWVGEATISAKVGNKTLKCNVNVLNEDHWSTGENGEYGFSIMPITKTKARVEFYVYKNGKAYSSGNLTAKYKDGFYLFTRQGKYNITGGFGEFESGNNGYGLLIITESDLDVFLVDELLFDNRTEST